MPADSDVRRGIFPRFTLLPIELRHRIWNLAYTPRVITIHKHFSHELNEQYLFCKDPVPAPLHVCRESRTVSPYVQSFVVGDSSHYVWWNISDTVCMPDYALDLVSPANQSQLSRLILNVDSWSDFLLYEIHDIAKLENLKDLTLLSNSDLRNWIETIDDICWWLKASFSGFPGRETWTLPRIKVVESRTGEELSTENLEQRGTELEQRREGQEREIGFGPDVSMTEGWDREARRRIEAVQRSRRYRSDYDYPTLIDMAIKEHDCSFDINR